MLTALILGLLVGLPIAMKIFWSQEPSQRELQRQMRAAREASRIGHNDYAARAHQLDTEARMQRVNAHLTERLNAAHARIHKLEQERPLSLYTGACPPPELVDQQGRRWRLVTTAYERPFDTGGHQGVERGISQHLERMLSDD